MSLKRLRAFISRITWLFRGFFSLNSALSPTAFMNSSLAATLTLKFSNTPGVCFMVMKSSMSGCQTSSTPMLAPRLLPPCLTTSVATSNMRMNDKGPEATPAVLLTMSPFGLSLENEKPVPPPLLWIMAVYFTASNMPSMSSSTGSTKHAASCPTFVPAFMSVGEFGRNSKLVIIWKKACSYSCIAALSAPYSTSLDAMNLATRAKSWLGVSTTLPVSSFSRYLRSSTWMEFSGSFRSSCTPRIFLISLSTFFLCL
ncbi:Uncharacterised protein [uncultured archaeon]|nr:Uncharacterised protein [uncultured archaeon]